MIFSVKLVTHLLLVFAILMTFKRRTEYGIYKYIHVWTAVHTFNLSTDMYISLPISNRFPWQMAGCWVQWWEFDIGSFKYKTNVCKDLPK